MRAKSLSWRDVFVEIPITVHNSALAVALMAEIEPPSTTTQQDFDRWGGRGDAEGLAGPPACKA